MALAFMDTGGHGFTTTFRGKADTPPKRRYWRNWSACPSGGKACVQGLPLRTPASTNSRRPLNSGALRCSSSLNDQHLPLRLRTAHQLRLQATYGDAIRFGRRNEFSKSPDRLTQRHDSPLPAASPGQSGAPVLHDQQSRDSPPFATVTGFAVTAPAIDQSRRAVASPPAAKWAQGLQSTYQTQKPTRRWLRSRPKASANTSQRRGHGIALRMATLGALMVNRRRSKRKRMYEPSPLKKHAPSNEKTARRRFCRGRGKPGLLKAARLTLRELLCTTCRVQTDLLTLHFTCITCREASLAPVQT